MNVYVTGAANDRAAAFERFVRSKGIEVERITVESTSPKIRFERGGIVVFDDGQHPVAECIARIRENTRYLCLPTIAVSEHQDANSRFLAAGAALVCDGATADDQILTEIRSRCDIQPVLEELRQRLLEPFISSSLITLKEMANTDISMRAVYQKTGYKMFGDISAVIGLMAQSEGSLVMSFPEATSQALAKRVLEGFSNELDADMISDCIGELANVIAGQAKGLLAGTPYEFKLATPTIVSGNGHEIRHKPGMPCLVAAFTSDVGDFALQLCFGMVAH